MMPGPDARQLDRALGAVAGALAGDAVGATLEFLGRRPRADEVGRALAMPGGGPFRVAPGQVTDDGELSLELLDALAGRDRYPDDEVAAAYVRWADSDPFDIGNTTAAALCGHRARSVQAAGFARRVRAVAARRNASSMANGSLMRVAPLGAWSARVTVPAALAAAVADARLSHPNPACAAAGAAYVAAIRHLVCMPGDADGAWSAASGALATIIDGPDGTDGTDPRGGATVQAWLDDAASGRLPGGEPYAGFVRIAFTHAFAHLQRRTVPEAAIEQTLAIGGDTDTNACIVGGLAGALHGAAALPARWLERLASVDSGAGRRPRPDRYAPSRLAQRVAALYGESS